jgi:hypothetical protein
MTWGTSGTSLNGSKEVRAERMLIWTARLRHLPELSLK